MFSRGFVAQEYPVLDIVVIQSRALLLCITVVMDFGASFLLSFGS